MLNISFALSFAIIGCSTFRVHSYILTPTISQLENAKLEVQKPFAFEDELKDKTDRLNALNIELNLDEKDPSAIDAEPEQNEEQPERKCANRER